MKKEANKGSDASSIYAYIVSYNLKVDSAFFTVIRRIFLDKTVPALH